MNTLQHAVHAWNDDGPGISMALKLPSGEDAEVCVGSFAPLHYLVLQSGQLFGRRLGLVCGFRTRDFDVACIRLVQLRPGQRLHLRLVELIDDRGTLESFACCDWRRRPCLCRRCDRIGQGVHVCVSNSFEVEPRGRVQIAPFDQLIRAHLHG